MPTGLPLPVPPPPTSPVLPSDRHTYIFVIDTFHEHQLPVRPLGVGLVLERSAQLLDGYISVQDSVVAGAAGRETQRVWM